MSSDEFNRCRAAIMVTIIGFGIVAMFLAWQIDKIRHALHL